MEQDTTVIGSVLDRLRNLVTSATVYGDPIERNGVTVIPAALMIAGGGGGGGDDSKTGSSGEGGGVGVIARPVGAYVVRGDQVSWKPAVSPAVLVFLALFGARLIRKLIRG